jgi:hypothetical protein
LTHLLNRPVTLLWTANDELVGVYINDETALKAKQREYPNALVSDFYVTSEFIRPS